MAMTDATSRHVWQVTELVRRLDRDEIRELIRLVPRLQREVTGERSGLVRWAREQMAQYADEAHPMQGEDAFVFGSKSAHKPSQGFLVTTEENAFSWPLLPRLQPRMQSRTHLCQ